MTKNKDKNIKCSCRKLGSVVAVGAVISVAGYVAYNGNFFGNREIQHDAEYYILYEQHKDAWKHEDSELNKKIAKLRQKYGTPPNIIHIMWDDNGIGDMGDPLFNKIRGFDTPNVNRMARDGMTFARMYTEPSSTPTRAATLTGRLPIRSGMFKVLFPPDGIGLPGEEVTIAEVLSKVGYATAFYGKAHQGDIEESYMHNQGFDESLVSLYNQWGPLAWHDRGTAGGLTTGWTEDEIDKDYALDKTFRPYDYIMAVEAKKGDRMAKEFARPPHEDPESYTKFEEETHARSLAFIKKNAQAKKPFYLAYWPSLPARLPKDIAKGEKWTTSNATWWAEGWQDLDKKIGQIRAMVEKQGIAKNTLIIMMADNGPMTEIAPRGPFTIFRGGKGDITEGGIRVPAWAYWPGVIEDDTVVGDMIHVSDLFTTFANLAGAKRYIPRDRVIDGLDQTALFLKGDKHGRRDYNYAYAGPILGAVTKQQFKRHLLNQRPGLVSKDFYDLYKDPREEHPVMAQMLWSWGNFDRMIQRHQALMVKYPNTPPRHGEVLKGIERLPR